jgi:molybdenum cofactor biosynthesis enzyme MoaA
LPKLIEDLKNLDVRGIDISGGGEPLCHPEIAAIIEKFAGCFDVGLVTNGYALDDTNNKEKARKLRQTILTNCAWCRISVDAGSQEIYSLMHGNEPHIQFIRLLPLTAVFWYVAIYLFYQLNNDYRAARASFGITHAEKYPLI